MIKSIRIQNYILIDELQLELDKGFNIFTGETGAGKSIIISAIDVSLGAKANKELIKNGKDRAMIEVALELDENFDKKILTDNGIDTTESIVISREITTTTTRSRINGILVTQDLIKEIRENLIDIHSQHQSYNYLQPKMHITLLDNFGNDSHKNLVNTYTTTFSSVQQLQNSLNKAVSAANATEQQIDFLKFQIKEIEDASIEDIEEDKKLEEELEILLNAEKLKELSYSAYWELYGEDGNITNALSNTKSTLSKLANLDTNTTKFEEDIINCQELLKDIAYKLKFYSENQEPDEQKINDIQERIDILDKLKRKYGKISTLESVLDKYTELTSELNSIEFSQDEVLRLENELKTINAKAENEAKELTQSRLILAKTLSEKITQELEKLELPKVKFEVKIDNIALCQNGFDKVEFLISTNISEPLKPLAKVASGGEISRIMLAIKTIFAQADKTNTVIFDEIDTGISGKASQAVADAIVELSKHHQVISITHQPIIAAKADKHLYVTKDQDNETKINVYDLQGENKIKGIAILASGEINDDSINFAKNLMGV
ncbi:MAG: DNA repair protein RecN [Candidatus Gastranaerophilales bacterium]|nr:DNA repair protein RecN [Candidatus Gastranaerophilales bacterium]